MRLMQMGRAPSVIGASAPRPGPDMGTQLGQGLGAIGKMLGEFGKQRKADQAHEAATKAVTGLLNTDRNAAMEAGGGPSIQAAEQMATTKPAIPERLNNIMRALTEAGKPEEAMKVYQQVMLREAPEQKPARIIKGADGFNYQEIVGSDGRVQWVRAIPEAQKPLGDAVTFYDQDTGEYFTALEGSQEYRDAVSRPGVVRTNYKAPPRPLPDDVLAQQMDIAAAGAVKTPNPMDEAVAAGREQEAKDMGKDRAAYGKTIFENAARARTALAKIDRGIDLLGKISTGTLQPFAASVKGWIQDFARMTGKEPPNWTKDLANVEAFGQIAGGFVMDTVALTKGAVSEKEMDLFMRWSPNLGQSVEGNRLMLKFMKRMSEQAVRHASWMEAQKDERGFLPLDIQARSLAWQEENPVFSDEDREAVDALIGGASNDELSPPPAKTGDTSDVGGDYSNLPSTEGVAEGTIRYGQNGEKIILRGGAWEKHDG